MDELLNYSMAQLLQLLRRRELSAVEVTEACLRQIERTDSAVHAFLTVCAEEALEQAKEADTRRARGEDGPLLGVPLTVKDVIVTQGVRTTAGSRILERYVPPYDATVMRKIRDAGGVLLGKVNCDEFAMGSSTENSAFGPTRNPWNVDRVPGGSSGGSAASVSARQCFGSLGSDTGGSIRQPAACCGIIGLKPTYGRVSRFGLIAYASSLDQIGPMTRTVRDAAMLLEVIAGWDPADATSSSLPVPTYSACLEPTVKGLRLALPKEFFGDGLDPEVRAAVMEAVTVFERCGATVQEVSLPHAGFSVPTYYMVATAEASSNLARFDGVRYGLRVGDEGGLQSMYSETRSRGFGAEVKRRIMLGTYALSAGYYDAYYLKALRVRTLIRRDFDAVFEQADLVVTPTAPTTAFRIGEKAGDPLQMYLSDVYTIAANLAGLPAISLPCGFDAQGLPIGVQLIARDFDEQTLLNASLVLEEEQRWYLRTPPLSAGANSR